MKKNIHWTKIRQIKPKISRYVGVPEQEKGYTRFEVWEECDRQPVEIPKLGQIRVCQINAEILVLIGKNTNRDELWKVSQGLYDDFTNVADAMTWCREKFEEDYNDLDNIE